MCVCVADGLQYHQSVSGFSAPGSLQREFWSPDPSPVLGRTVGGAGSLPLAEGGGASWPGERAALRKTVSVDDRLLQPASAEQPHLRLLSRLERGRKKLHNFHVSTTPRVHAAAAAAAPPSPVPSVQSAPSPHIWTDTCVIS